MKIRKKYLPLYVLLTLSAVSFAQSRNKTYETYIEKYYSIAQEQQATHKIPASITLAQGLLESGAGLSYLAVSANNHFGIKCHDWTGATEYRDDDKKNECFRKYKSAADSYEDHSQFLTSRPRYNSLFTLEPTNYQGWAHGLKHCGYATDPLYASKLISIIETYELHRYDTSESLQNREPATQQQKQTPPSFEEFTIGSVKATAQHPVYYNNNIKCVIAEAGDTYGSIGDEFNVSEKHIRSYNDVNASTKLKQGDWVYIRPKKSKAAKNNQFHTVQAGESMHSISQYYGIKLESLYKLNEMSFSAGAALGQSLKLR